MKIIYSCVVDGNPKFFRQAVLLTHSLKSVGVAAADILINLTPRAAPYRARFEAMGCKVRDTVLFGDGKYCNKVAQLRNVSEDVDFAVCCDTDMVFLRNIATDLLGREGRVLGKVVDFDNPPIDRFYKLHALVGDLPEIGEVACDLNGAPTFAGNFNGGLYIMPGQHLRALSETWEEMALRLDGCPEVAEVLGEFSWHIDQISFCFALSKLGLDYEILPITFNYPLHFEVPVQADTEAAELRILHYHDAIDENGFPAAERVRNNEIKALIPEVSEVLRTMITLQQDREPQPGAASRFTFLAGFHRSGTSLLASGCDAIGYSVGAGPLMAASFDNPKGYYENKRLVKINEAIQRDVNSDWDDIFFALGDQEPRLSEKYRLKIRDFLNQEFLIDPQPNYVLKDPRVMQTYGIWRKAIRAMGLNCPEIIFIHRNPLECAQSQRARYETSFEGKGEPFHYFGKDLRETLLLWYAYSMRFLMTLDGERMIMLRYSDLLTSPEPVLQQLADWSGLGRDDAQIKRFVSGFFETGLRHHERSSEELRQATLEIPYVYKLFQQLEALADKPQLHRQDIHAIVRLHRDPFAELMQFDFLGRLFSGPKQKWINERHRRMGGG